MAIHLHYIRDRVLVQKSFDLVQINTQDMVADFLTKAHPSPKHHRFVSIVFNLLAHPFQPRRIPIKTK